MSKVIDLTHVTSPATPFIPPTSEEKLKQLISSWIYACLQREGGWKQGEVEVVESGWLAGTTEAWAYADVRLGGGQPTRCFINRALYDADYAQLVEEEETAVEAILAVARGDAEVVVGYSEDEEIVLSAVEVVFYEHGEKVASPRFSVVSYADRLLAAAKRVRRIAGAVPAGNLEDMGGIAGIAEAVWRVSRAEAYIRD